MQYLPGVEFSTKNNFSHYVNDRTDEWHQSSKQNSADCVKNNRCKQERLDSECMAMAVAWAKEQNLLDPTVKWYWERGNKGHILENSQAKLVWEFEFNLRKTTSRRLDLMLEEKQTKTIWICHMPCLQEHNIEIETGKKNQFQEAFKIKKRRSGFKVKVVLLVISVFGGGIKEILKKLKNMFEKDDFCEKIVAEM